ncbi:MAG TPA: hypothetical protein VH914_09150 [Acidimicrobiia bacterium]|jgi:hypothetical protein|nr:hypothetical protein [Acidimicrobiia bacterium]
MRRLSAWLIGPLALAAVAGMAGPVAAATTKPLAVQGQYVVYGSYNKKPRLQSFSLTLYKNHTGTDHFNDTITWSLDGKNLTMIFDKGLWTYHGVKHVGGFNTVKKPGTLANVNGGYGTWYAVPATT